MPLPPLRPTLRLPFDLLKGMRQVWRETGDGVVLLKAPGVVASMALLAVLMRRRRFAVQVVGDALDVGFKANVGGPLGKISALLLGGATAVACRRAAVVAYVTREYLQTWYPPGRRTSAHWVSDVRIPQRLVGAVAELRPQVERIVTVASIEVPYKRLDLLFEAVARLQDEGRRLHVDVVGDGRLRRDYETLARALAIVERVSFHGQVPHDEVFALLQQGDLFVLCSDTEGMPRALIEAMAIGLPCVGSSVGGIIELLPQRARFEPGSVDDLVRVLKVYLDSEGARCQLARRLRETAEQFSPEVMGVRSATWAADVLRLDGAR